MKIIRFLAVGSNTPQFGIVAGDYAVSFEELQRLSGKVYQFFSDSDRYLQSLPDSESAARVLLDWALENIGNIDEKTLLSEAVLLEPVRIAALYDFALTPRHIENALSTMLTYEEANPETFEVMSAIKKALVSGPRSEADEKMGALSYYKSNMCTIVGENEAIPWPLYTSRLDIEPELAVVYGNDRQPVAGYCIFNDVSARDIQIADLVSGMGLNRSKDMEAGNQLGPFLVTVDEIGDPYDLKVEVKVNGELTCKGSTSEISHKAEDVFSYLETFIKIKPGTAVGFGTVSDTTALDHDGPWIEPGSEIEISIERLGTLRCRFATPTDTLYASRWPVRPEMEKYHS